MMRFLGLLIFLSFIGQPLRTVAQQKSPYVKRYVHTHFGSFSYMSGFSLATYGGDLANAWNLKRQRWGANPSVQLGVNYQLTEYWRLRAEIAYLNLFAQSSEDNWGNRSFNGHNLTTSLLFQHSLFQQSYVDAIRIRWNPYMVVGIGSILFYPRSTAENPYPMPPYSNASWVIPFGAGVEYSRNDFLKLSLEYLSHATMTDYLDDTSPQERPSQKDWFFTIGVKVIYRINHQYSYRRGQRKFSPSERK